ncbi:interferon beta [Phyllostomus hastatus]|uniref:interferon beta-like n=1 Tax=Phyllostomus hastatus TaxID=9423 RepID=UPI001E684856|nr:interferon beta-like [Phyllostomus hastatus]XP_045696931.1 interferon beta [Phyllostomus hastatus]
MANGSIVQMALLLCFSTTALSMSYDVLQFQQRGSISACWTLIRQLNGTSHSCLQDRIDFKFPQEIQPQKFQKEEAMLVIHEMLQQIFDLFTRNFSSTGWNETIIGKLYGELSWQVDHLEAALVEIEEEETFTWEKNTTLLLLQDYYSQIGEYLETKLYSRCAWIEVRRHILRNFSVLHKLIDLIFKN